MSEWTFDVDQHFDADYLYFYEPRLAEVSDADTELICRLLELAPGAAMLDLAPISERPVGKCETARVSDWGHGSAEPCLKRASAGQGVFPCQPRRPRTQCP